MADLRQARSEMVAHQILERGVRSKAVARAMREVPREASVVAAGGPKVPSALREQLAIGGRLVMPIGDTPREQRLVRVERVGENQYDQEDLLPVRFVPLIGEQGWAEDAPRAARVPLRLPELIARAAERFAALDKADLEPLL